MKAYPVKSLYEEMAFIACYFHWSHAEIMELEHHQRRLVSRDPSDQSRA